MKILLLAGEPSGDRYAAGIARALREEEPTVELRAMGGAQLAAAGVPLVVDSTELAVVGLTEVLSRLPALLRAKRRLLRELDHWRPDVVVPVDYPDFNLRIARQARQRDIPVAYFISPQVWAWRPGRIPSIGKSISRMLVIFPFETRVYEEHGIPVEHVGHPLMDFAQTPFSREEARRALSLPTQAGVVALLPGSRQSEIRRTWPVFLEAARLLARARPGLRFVIPLATGLSPEDFPVAEGTEGPSLVFLSGGAAKALAACDVAAVASGTATLETALARRPFVVGYQVSRLTSRVSRRLAEPDFLARGLFALPNLILGKGVVPELYQERFTATELEAQLARLLDDEQAGREQVEELARIPALLGGTGTLARVASAVLATAEREAPATREPG